MGTGSGQAEQTTTVSVDSGIGREGENTCGRRPVEWCRRSEEVVMSLPVILQLYGSPAPAQPSDAGNSGWLPIQRLRGTRTRVTLPVQTRGNIRLFHLAEK
ncbi:hypothetical protein B296_00038935 [Ensete ventricosum]|uniref:Uncharacterized protein n=1 Tax=Ensete ventricosum TaxID=4639 RepID=A0A426ZRK6_ENSVE|nr:hypothetical protein B296_00038935 [Ensete ventricosum]